MASVDAGIKYKGLSLEGEYYWRWLSDFTGHRTRPDIADIDDHGFQVQSSAMVVPKSLQVLSQRVGDPGPLRQRLGGAGGRELVLARRSGGCGSTRSGST